MLARTPEQHPQTNQTQPHPTKPTETNRTTSTYLYRRGSWPPTLIFENQPELNNFKMAVQHPVIITARDGLRLPAYLTLPVKPSIPAVLPASVTGDLPTAIIGSNSDGSGSAHYATPAQIAAARAPSQLNLSLPMVLYVHGGPWARDSWGSDPITQWLANRGYAVLQVNFRGSSGFGKSFLNAGNGEWGVGKMQHDLTDSVRWAVAKGIADPKRVCIFGGSYGGYATLAGLVFMPELYRCVVRRC